MLWRKAIKNGVIPAFGLYATALKCGYGIFLKGNTSILPFLFMISSQFAEYFLKHISYVRI